MIKRIFAVILTLCMAFSIFSCKGTEYSHCELVLPLSADYQPAVDELYDKLYTDGQSSVAILRISFDAAVLEGISDAHTAEEFGRYWLLQCGRVATVKSEPNVDYCEYYDSSTGLEYYYLVAFYRTPNAYFIVLFMSDKASEDTSRVKFLEYARGTYFKEWSE